MKKKTCLSEYFGSDGKTHFISDVHEFWDYYPDIMLKPMTYPIDEVSK